MENVACPAPFVVPFKTAIVSAPGRDELKLTTLPARIVPPAFLTVTVTVCVVLLSGFDDGEVTVTLDAIEDGTTSCCPAPLKTSEMFAIAIASVVADNVEVPTVFDLTVNVARPLESVIAEVATIVSAAGREDAKETVFPLKATPAAFLTTTVTLAVLTLSAVTDAGVALIAEVAAEGVVSAGG